MPFTEQQIATLKALYLTDPIATAYAQAGDDVPLAAWFNADAVPAYIVWRTSVSKAEIMQDPSFDWTRMDNLSVGKARIWTEMFSFGTIDPSNSNVRAGIAATWTGTTADNAVQAAVLAKCKRSASRAEKALAAGSGTTLSPSVMTWSGVMTYAEASLIRS